MVGTPNYSRIVSCKPRLSGMERPVLWCGLDVNDTSEGAKIVVEWTTEFDNLKAAAMQIRAEGGLSQRRSHQKPTVIDLC